MSTQTYKQQFQALSARLRFIQKRIWAMSSGPERDAMSDTIAQLQEELKEHFGKKIASEIYWSVKER